MATPNELNATAYDYDTQRWVTGAEALRILRDQQAEIDALTPAQRLELARMCAKRSNADAMGVVQIGRGFDGIDEYEDHICRDFEGGR